MPSCTIIIVNWNSWDCLFDCLDGLSRQTCQDFQVIVIDNASADTAPAARLSHYPRLRYVANTENIGFAAANNQGITLAQDCRWIVLLNPDTLPEADWLMQLLAAAQNRPDYKTFGSCLVQAGDRNLLDGIGDVYHISGLAWRAGHGRPCTTAPATPQPIFSPCAAAALYDRQAVLEVGGFDETYFCYHEDVDLGFRLQLAGHKSLTVPQSRVVHLGSGTTSYRSDFAVYYGHRNLIWTWYKDMPFLFLLLFGPAHLFWNLLLVIVHGFRGQGRVICKAKFDGYRALPGVLRKRRAVQRLRRVRLSLLWHLLDKRLLLGVRR
jgi:GT2 family glycosyltransferase